MKNNNIVLEPGELDELEEVEFRRVREHAEKYLRAHGYEILSCELEVLRDLYDPYVKIYVKITAVKDGEKILYRQLVK